MADAFLSSRGGLYIIVTLPTPASHPVYWLSLCFSDSDFRSKDGDAVCELHSSSAVYSKIQVTWKPQQ